MTIRSVAVLIAAASAVGAVVWARATFDRVRFFRRLPATATEDDDGVRQLAVASVLRDLHAFVVYAIVGVAAASVAIFDSSSGWYALGLLFVPVVTSLLLAGRSRQDARLAEHRLNVERRAREMMSQADVAPLRWAERLAPTQLPDTPGFEVATLHEAGAGVMSGDMVDVFHLRGGRLCCVVGDVSGHGVEASITAMQTKYLLRSYLAQYRDPGQALEELNSVLLEFGNADEFLSLFVGVFDPDANTLRYASAGHPPGWLLEDRDVRSLRSTGSLLMMDANARYHSREEPFSANDVIVVVSDGVSEARSGTELFGEERTAALVRRNASASAEVLCKSLLDAAAEFADGPIADDVTVLAVRRG